MLDKLVLSNVERSLSNAWGGDVRLVFQEDFEEHPHVMRLAVSQAPASAPSTVILKKSRTEGEERDRSSDSSIPFFNDWASLEYLRSILGNESFAPQVFAGDKQKGFFVMEDLGDGPSLENALWNGDFSEAAQAMVQYGELLGILHGKSVGRSNQFSQIRERLDPRFSLKQEDYSQLFEIFTSNLKSLKVEFTPSVLDELREGGKLLSHPGGLSVFTHGDPVLGNILNRGGRWRLIDFEAARFRNALIEGVYPRMFFPTSGLAYVMRIPEQVWRQAESAYRTKLEEYVPAAGENTLFGPALTASCAFWILNLCNGWLEHAIAGDLPPERVHRVRQCIIARCESFIKASQEFHCMPGLCGAVEKMVVFLSAQWSQEDRNLPFYPAFL